MEPLLIILGCGAPSVPTALQFSYLFPNYTRQSSLRCWRFVHLARRAIWPLRLSSDSRWPPSWWFSIALLPMYPCTLSLIVSVLHFFLYSLYHGYFGICNYLVLFIFHLQLIQPPVHALNAYTGSLQYFTYFAIIQYCLYIRHCCLVRFYCRSRLGPSEWLKHFTMQSLQVP